MAYPTALYSFTMGLNICASLISSYCWRLVQHAFQVTFLRSSLLLFALPRAM